MPRHSIVSLRRTTKEKTDGSLACSLASLCALYSLSDRGGSHCIKRAIAGVMHAKISSASAILNGRSCNLADRIKISILLALSNTLCCILPSRPITHCHRSSHHAQDPQYPRSHCLGAPLRSYVGCALWPQQTPRPRADSLRRRW